MERSACKELMNQVISQDLCTLCGACVGLCPYLLAYRGKVVARDSCGLEDGQCYQRCPRITFDPNLMSRAIFGEPYGWSEIGTARKILMAKSTDESIKAKAQYGGVVTALVALALEEKIIDSAVLTRSKDRILAEGVMVSSPKAALECAGSTYVATPTLEALNRNIQKNKLAKVGVVGVPCQVMAVAKLKSMDPIGENHGVKPVLAIGLFCTWALSYDGLAEYLMDIVSPKRVLKVNIPPPPSNVFEIYTGGEPIRVPLEDIREFIRPACNTCVDMTAEFADLSVGAAEGVEGWNTVIVRSDIGEALLEKAKARRLVEVRDLPESNTEHLKEAALLKKKRALKNIIQKSGGKKGLLYLRVHPEDIKPYLND
jgi:coenzyme F420 hydrogenase subunit beta